VHVKRLHIGDKVVAGVPHSVVMSDTDTKATDTKAPVTKAYGDSWYAATMVDAPPRPPLSFDLDVDVCVIGGGLAGLTAAREIARSGWSVVLLEAGRLAASASGRNTGFVLPGFGADADKLIARVGFERTKDLWTLSQAGLDYVRNAIRADGATGVDPQDGWLYVSKKDNTDEFLSYVALLGELGCDIEGWATERVRSVLRSERYFNAINYLRAFTIHPVNYALALAAAAERDGARIFEDTPALSIDPTGVRKRIVTPDARLRANHVVLCGNVQLGSLMPQLAATLLPVTTYVITTAPLGERLGEAIGYRGAVSDTDLADNHYRIVGGDRLMLSGRSTAWVRAEGRYQKDLSAARRRCRRLFLGRDLGHHHAPHAADRRTRSGCLACQRLRRPRPQHHRNGGQSHCARDRRRRSDLAAIHAFRTRLGGRRFRPGGGANARLDQAAARGRRGAPRQGPRAFASPSA
jgi:glycine/D-amino acid oxidase-like deaminating enzyme